jgi:O-antigen ligase
MSFSAQGSGQAFKSMNMRIWPCLWFLALVPLLGEFRGSFHDLQRLWQIPVLLVAATCLFLMAPRSFAWTAPGKCVGALVGVLALLAVLASARPAVALRELLLMAGLYCVLLWVAWEAARKLAVRNLMLAAAAVAWGLYGLFFMVRWAAALQAGATQSVPVRWLLEGFDNQRFLNHSQTVGIPLLIAWLSLPHMRRWQRCLGWFALLTSFMLLLATMGRSTLLALGFSASCALLLLGQPSYSYARRLLLAALGGAILYGLFFLLLPTLLAESGWSQERSISNTDSMGARQILWQLALQDFLSSPWLGIGPMHYSQHVLGDAAHPHNQLLLLVAEYGFPLTLLVLFATWRLLFAATWRLRLGGAHDGADLAIWCAVIAALVDSMFSGNFVMPFSQLWIAVVCGLLYAQVLRPSLHHQAGPVPEGCAQALARTSAALLLIGQLVLCAVVFWDACSDAPPCLAAADRVGLCHEQIWHPRFWAHGRF